MDLDPNYDPSDFLKMPSFAPKAPQQQIPNESIKVEYSMELNVKQEPHSQSQVYGEQSFSVSETASYEQTVQIDALSQKDTTQPSDIDTKLMRTESPDGGEIHDDLAISDTDEEDQGRQVPKEEGDHDENDDDGDGLWF